MTTRFGMMPPAGFPIMAAVLPVPTMARAIQPCTTIWIRHCINLALPIMTE